jgi:hypothetical protein
MQYNHHLLSQLSYSLNIKKHQISRDRISKAAYDCNSMPCSSGTAISLPPTSRGLERIVFSKNASFVSRSYSHCKGVVPPSRSKTSACIGPYSLLLFRFTVESRKRSAAARTRTRAGSDNTQHGGMVLLEHARSTGTQATTLNFGAPPDRPLSFNSD